MEHVNEHDSRAVTRIAKLRQHREMTQQQLADACGMRRAAISAIETGTRALKFGEAVRICAALGVEVADLASPKPLVVRAETTFE